MAPVNRDVRFTPKSGHSPASLRCPLSATSGHSERSSREGIFFEARPLPAQAKRNTRAEPRTRIVPLNVKRRVDQSRQCVGQTSMRVLLPTIQPPRIRRHGRAIACTPSESISASSRSRSNGAVETGRHIKHRPWSAPAQRRASMEVWITKRLAILPQGAGNNRPHHDSR
jgi:hypothetical protein